MIAFDKKQKEGERFNLEEEKDQPRMDDRGLIMMARLLSAIFMYSSSIARLTHDVKEEENGNAKT